MKEATADKKVLLYLTALGIVNTSISAIGLKESAKKSSKYSFNPEDIEKAIRKVDQAWENISIGISKMNDNYEDCTCCNQVCEQYDWDEESICEYINNHIKDLHVDDCGAFQVRDEKIGKVVDMEWNDGVSGFVLKDVLDYIKENGTVKRSELMEFTC